MDQQKQNRSFSGRLLSKTVNASISQAVVRSWFSWWMKACIW